MDGCYEPALVPELLVVDIDRGLVFWRDECGFEIRYSRPEARFADIALGSAHVMLEQNRHRPWITGLLEAPLGRGINCQITVPDTVLLPSPASSRLAATELCRRSSLGSSRFHWTRRCPARDRLEANNRGDMSAGFACGR